MEIGTILCFIAFGIALSIIRSGASALVRLIVRKSRERHNAVVR